jgi:hypothetical protein
VTFHTPEWSYRRHSQHEETGELPSIYTKPMSVDAWRHTRMLATVLPLVRSCPDATWMTIGDGRYGSDAFFLERHGVNVTATSLTTTSLRLAHESGHITKYRAENAECLSASDDSYDFVLCKESYHHFPRPPVAFYEMFRVASQAVVLIEPIEAGKRVLDEMKQLIKKLIRGDETSSFEPSGNFLYRLNVREIEKMMTALNGSFMAVKHFNDFFHRKLASRLNDPISLGALATRTGIVVQDVLCQVKLLNYGLATIVAFKITPRADLQSALRKEGFRVNALLQNPYL